MATSRTTRAHLPAGTVLDGRFRLGEPLGSGGMGTVYRAVQTTIGREVAVKVLRKDIARDTVAVKRFHREAQAVSILKHPNVVTVHDFGQLADASLYLVLELIEGRDLGHLIEEQGRLAPERVVHIASQILDALEEAHSQGVVHRDLKPDNILLSNRAGNLDFVKVVDFGLAKVAEQATLTKTGEVFGTPVYISPEQARGQRSDHRVDLYALGVVLYEMFTGAPPFRGHSSMALLMKHMRERPPSFVQSAPDLELGAALQQVVMRALEKRPQDRYGSAAEMRDAMKGALDAHEREFNTDPYLTGVDDPRRTDPNLGPSPGDTVGSAPTAELSEVDSSALRALAASRASTTVGDAPAASVEPKSERASMAGLDSEGTDIIDLEAIGLQARPLRGLAVAGAALAAFALLVWLLLPSEPPAPEPAVAAVKPVEEIPAGTAPAKPAAPKEAQAPAKAPMASSHAVALASTPVGAAVEVAVRSPGATVAVVHRFAQTPARLAVTAGSEVRATFRLDGHTPATLSWKSDGDRELVQHLVAQAVSPRGARREPSAREPSAEKNAPPTPPRPTVPAKSEEEELDDLK